MKTYLCGGINGLSDADCHDWRDVAKSLLKTETLDPMRRDYRGREDECVAEIVQGDLEDIADSDFVLVNAVKPSWGTAMEVYHAFAFPRRYRMTIAFVGDSRVSPWLRRHVHHIAKTIEEACELINQVAR